MSIQSTLSDGPSARGAAVTRSAPAPSDSIQRRNSLLNGRSDWSSPSSTFGRTCGSKCDARRLGDASSEPVTTALPAPPATTLRTPYLSAVTPEQHTPLMDVASQGGQPSSA